MAAEQRRLLEQLMGDQAFTGYSSRGPQLKITDPKVCKSYLVGTCPYDLFTNTKQDLGVCPSQHSEKLKAEYEASPDEQKKQWGFDFDYMRDMQRYVNECDRRIDSASRRLEKTADEVRQTNALLKQIGELTRTVEIGLEEVQVLGEGGAVNLAVQDFFKIRQAKVMKDDRERELKALSDTSGPSGHQKLQVCDVCGAYLSRLDNDRRLADHFFGKMHLGYAQMRKTVETLKKELKGRAPPQRQPEEGRGGDDGDRGYGRQGGYRGGGGYGGRGGGGGGYGGRGREGGSFGRRAGW